MNMQTKFDIELTVRSFAYVAKRLARSPAAPAPCALYEQILGEAEKHRAALRLVQRDLLEMAERGLREQKLTKAEFQQLRDSADRAVAHAQGSITRIAARYAPHKLAA
jgi:hypothetical protein